MTPDEGIRALFREEIESCMPLAMGLARRYRDAARAVGIGREELAQVAALALCQAHENWDPDLGKLKTFAYPRIRGALCDAIADHHTRPRPIADPDTGKLERLADRDDEEPLYPWWEDADPRAMEALEAMDETRQRVFRLRLFGSEPWSYIARNLEIPESTARSHYRSAARKILKVMGNPDKILKSTHPLAITPLGENPGESPDIF